MALTTPFRRHSPLSRCPYPSSSVTKTQNVSSSRRSAKTATYSASLGSWAERWNHSSLKDITLAHVLSGDTVSPISLSDFEAFLTFCDISVENLQFVVWFQDYRARFEALPVAQRAHSQPPCERLAVAEETDVGYRHQSGASFTAVSGESKSSAQRSMEDIASQSKDYHDTIQRLAGATRIASPLRINPPKTVEGSKSSPLPTPMTSIKDNQAVSVGLPPSYAMNARSNSVTPPTTQTTEASSIAILSFAGGVDRTGNYPPLPGGQTRGEFQPFFDEIQNVLATFLVPGSKKELLLSSEIRDTCVREAQNTTHPQSFAAAYEQAYQLVELVSLPRFLANAATNINRPRQLFWYSASVPALLLGIAIALYFILSPFAHAIIPPQSHRAWRLLSLPPFFLSSLCWYKGFRGFCPLLFLRSSRQLRVWELERLSDDSEAQSFVVQLTKRPLSSSPIITSPFHDSAGDHIPVVDSDPFSVPTTPISPTNSEKAKARIAPFLEVDGKSTSNAEFDGFRCPGPEPSSPSPHSTSRPVFPPSWPLNSTAISSSSPVSSLAGRSSGSSSFHRPPIFGPSKVVEDARIRRVHLHLLWSLMRFGLICTAIIGAVVVAVPSAHSN